MTKPENHKCGIDCGGGAWCIYDERRSTSAAYNFENRNYFDRPWTTASQYVDRMPLVPGPTPEDMPDIIKRAKQFVAGELKDEVDYSTPFAEKVLAITDSIAELLVTKNQAYGNSALDPVRIFSSANPAEQIRVRMDDKLSRIRNGDKSEDALLDLLGYGILLKIAEGSSDGNLEAD